MSLEIRDDKNVAPALNAAMHVTTIHCIMEAVFDFEIAFSIFVNRSSKSFSIGQRKLESSSNKKEFERNFCLIKILLVSYLVCEMDAELILTGLSRHSSENQ